MLSKILCKPHLTALYRNNRFARQMITRNFSSEISPVSSGATSVEPFMKPSEPGTYKNTTGQDYNQMLHELEAHDKAKEADYLEMLNDQDARQKFFSALTTHDTSQHSEVNMVKSKISKLIQQEIGEMDFQK